jgi:signal peptide peptidase SppA
MFDLNLSVPRKAVPFFDCWVGAWAMHEPNFHQLRQQIEALNLTLHLSNGDANRQSALDRIDESFSTVQEGIGIINLSGPLMKHASSFSESCSTVEARSAINKMANDPNIRGIMIRIESPGGTVAGTKELADTIKMARSKKPIMAYCSDLCASAAYWIASQCQTIDANATSLVGSIGTYCVVTDSSKAAEKIGLKVHVVRAGEYKGAGTPGTEITDSNLAEFDRTVQGLNMFFLDAVSDGRSMPIAKVSELADGRIHLAEEAKSNGLIDNVCSFEESFDRFSQSVSVGSDQLFSQQNLDKDYEMATEPTNVVNKPATLAEINTAFPKASADWRLSALQAGWTLDQCRQSYTDILQAQLEAQTVRAEAAERKAGKPGVKALKSGSGKRARAEDMPVDDEEEMTDDEEEVMEEEDDAVAAWDVAVSREMKSCGGNRQKALSQANRKNPGLRAQMLEQVNAKRNRRSRR